MLKIKDLTDYQLIQVFNKLTLEMLERLIEMNNLNKAISRFVKKCAD